MPPGVYSFINNFTAKSLFPIANKIRPIPPALTLLSLSQLMLGEGQEGEGGDMIDTFWQWSH